MKSLNFFGNYWTSINQKRGMLILAVSVFLVEATNFGLSSFFSKSQKNLEIEVLLEQSSSNSSTKDFVENNAKTKNLRDFDPNLLDEIGWQKLGFTAKQASVILKYKYSLGGYFKNKEQIKSCFVISDWQYKKLEPYIKISAKNIQSSTTNYSVKSRNQEINNIENSFSVQKKEISFFNPNSLTKEGWEQLGFSSKQAESILKYKNALGGSFKNKEQIKKCFVISDFMYNKISSKIVFDGGIKSEITSENSPKNLNQIGFLDLQQLGIDAVLAKRIVNYRNSLGWFVNINQIQEVFGVSAKEIEILKENFTLENPTKQKKSLKESSLDNLKKHPYTQKNAEYIFNSLLDGKSLHELEKISDEEKKKIYWYFR